MLYIKGSEQRSRHTEVSIVSSRNILKGKFLIGEMKYYLNHKDSFIILFGYNSGSHN